MGMNRREHSPGSLERRHGRLRRTAATGAAGLALAVGANTALEAYNIHQHPTETRTTYKNFATNLEAMREFPDTYWVIFPGAGVDTADSVESQLAPVMHRYGQSFTVAPSPARIEPDEIASQINHWVNPNHTRDDHTIRLRLYGISMGGMLAWEVGKELERDYPNIMIESVVFDSSPGSIEDVNPVIQPFVYSGAAIGEMGDLPYAIPNPLKGGPLSRFATNSANAAFSRVFRGESPIPSSDELATAWRIANGTTSTYVNDQLRIIDTFDPTSDAKSLPHAKFAYFGASRWYNDDTVNVAQAAKRYRSLIGGRQLDVYGLDGISHASADVSPTQYRRALQSFIDRSGFVDIETARKLNRASCSQTLGRVACSTAS